tara:strand:+ start:17964 stop:19010 length:1047 start_codon:yes stop_codon:yes gene_type:complete
MIKKNPSKILVIQTAKIGDLVCSTPVFREIKKHYPQSFLSVLVLPLTQDILVNNPYIDQVILLDRKKYPGIKGALKLIKEIRKIGFDWSFSLVPGILESLIPFIAGINHRVSTTSKYASRKTKILSILNNHRLAYQRDSLALKHYLNLLRFIGVDKVSQKKEIFVDPTQEEKALLFLEKHNLKIEDFLVGISVTAGKEFKQWAPEKFAQLADRLIEESKAKVIFIGSPKDEAIIKETQSLMKNESLVIMELSLIELAGLLKKLSLFISVDTGPIYIANAVGTPVVDIVGPCQMRSQSPDGKFALVQELPPCGPCSYIMSAPSYCRTGHLKCIKDITVDDVFEAVKKIT